MSKKKIKARCEMDTLDESYMYEGRFKIVKRVLEVPITERIITDEEQITTYEICVERQNNADEWGFSDCRIYLDETDVPEDLLKILEKYSENIEGL